MATENKLNERIIQLLDLTERAYDTKGIKREGYRTKVNDELYHEFRTSCLSFILKLYGKEHPYFISFNFHTNEVSAENILKGRGILNSIKSEIDMGWLSSLKGLVSAELFSDFLEMAEHLLEEKFKDPAAVVIGSVLEEHLRNLCIKNNISTKIIDGKGKSVNKKASVLNDDLAKAGIYNSLEQKSITALLGLRNSAAHGKYADYDLQQVKAMRQSVSEFIIRNPL